MSDVPPRPDLWPPPPPPSPYWPAPSVPPAPGAPEESAESARATWTWWQAILFVLLGVVIASFAGALVEFLLPRGAPKVLTGSIVVDLVVLGVLILWLRARHPTWKRVIGFPKRWFKEGLTGFLGGLVIRFLAVFPVAVVLVMVLEAISGKTSEAPKQIGNHMTGIRLITAVIFAVCVAPVAEEFFFRGCLFNAFRAKHRFAVAAPLSALAFGAVHYLPAPWQDSLLLCGVMFFVGCSLAWLYERRGNIVAPMFAHATFNAVGLIFLALVHR